LCQFTHPGPAIQIPGQCGGAGKERWGVRTAEGLILGGVFLSWTGILLSLPGTANLTFRLIQELFYKVSLYE